MPNSPNPPLDPARKRDETIPRRCPKPQWRVLDTSNETRGIQNAHRSSAASHNEFDPLAPSPIPPTPPPVPSPRPPAPSQLKIEFPNCTKTHPARKLAKMP